MANKNIQMKHSNNGEWDNLYPITLTENVIDNEGKNIEEKMTNLKENITTVFNDLDENIKDLKINVDNEISIIENDINNLETNLTNIIDIDTYHSGNFKEITYTSNIDNATGEVYHLVIIPKTSKKGDIKIKHYIPPKKMTGQEFSKIKNTSLIINASRWNTTNGNIYGVQIVDGVIIHENQQAHNYILGINDNGDFKHFDPFTTAQEILSQGYKNTVTGFSPLIENGQKTSYHTDSPYGWDSKHPRQVIGTLESGERFVMTVEGRLGKQKGLTYEELQNLLLRNNVKYAFDLDGGGSAQTYVNGNKINNSTDEGNSITNSRPVADFLYIENPNDKSDLERDFNNISERVSTALNNIKNLTDIYKGFLRIFNSNATNTGIEIYDNDIKKSKYFLTPSRFSIWDYEEGKTWFSVSKEGGITLNGIKKGEFNASTNVEWNLNTMIDSGFYWAAPTSEHNAYNGEISHALLYIKLTDKEGIQMAIPYNNDVKYKIKIRRKDNNGLYQSWREM